MEDYIIDPYKQREFRRILFPPRGHQDAQWEEKNERKGKIPCFQRTALRGSSKVSRLRTQNLG